MTSHAHAGFDRIPQNVEERIDQVRVAIQLPAPGTVLEEMIGATVTPIRSPGVIAVQLMEASRESLLGCAQHDVVVIGH
ncbi:MAG TPA: hypothetical protein VFM96_10680 [Gaiellaceae bacterium]|nr:hypothetical protein [Gaiellaceae bacterium]